MTARTDTSAETIRWEIERCRTTEFLRIDIEEGTSSTGIDARTIVPAPACDSPTEAR